ncbi:MAG: DUF1501 domain-containing protein, partial [Chthoniobacteraceae bacterium]|nr:DUF1501 domain-containing protein [Chthoniobacteraceae bacterium]
MNRELIDGLKSNRLVSRRQALSQAGFGMGSLALAGMLSEMGLTQANASASLSPLAPRGPTLPGTAKRVIHLFMNGGPSQMDTFDPKPKLNQFHGKSLPGKEELGKDKRLSGAALGSPFAFKKHGQSGIEISELFPQVAKHADDLCVIRSMFSDVPNHESALMMMNTGNLTLPRPSVGSWVLYGLGSENQSLPG